MPENSHVFTLHQADLKDLSDFATWLWDSEFGRDFLHSHDHAEAFLRSGVERCEVVCAHNKRDENIGFVWSSSHGAFGRFPYLHAIAIKPAYRSIGVGSFLLEHVEETAFGEADALFALADSSSTKLLRFFQRRNYRSIGKIPNLALQNRAGGPPHRSGGSWSIGNRQISEEIILMKAKNSI